MWDSLFLLANASVLPFWALLVLAPRSALTRRLADSVAVPALYGVAYVALMAVALPGGEGGFGSLPDLKQSFSQDAVLVLGWVHYLCFDLFVGLWELRDSQRLRIPHWQLVPCLLLTLFAGPFGLVVYLLVRRSRAGFVFSGRET